jgi:predicted amidophosphoribosyltransferase
VGGGAGPFGLGLAAARAALLDVLDLVLPATCAGCGAQPGLLCGACRTLLAGRAGAAWPDPTPDGLPAPWAVAPYSGAVREVVIAHKEQGRHALAKPLGAALAASVRAAVAGAPSGRLVLVPMPSRAAALRARGHDPTLAMTRWAARTLRRERSNGSPVVVLPVLRLASSVTDQAGLDARARAVNLREGVRLSRRHRRLLDQQHSQGRTAVLLVDDIITTGASLASAAATLRRAGTPVQGAAVVAATPRRTPPRPMPGVSPGARGG